MIHRLKPYDIYLFCGKLFAGDPWNLKKHIHVSHKDCETAFIPHLNAMIRRWMKT